MQGESLSLPGHALADIEKSWISQDPPMFASMTTCNKNKHHDIASRIVAGLRK